MCHTCALTLTRCISAAQQCSSMQAQAAHSCACLLLCKGYEAFAGSWTSPYFGHPSPRCREPPVRRAATLWQLSVAAC